LVLSIEGEAGVGKTRLAEEMITLARQSGRAVAQARCYQGESTLAYTPYQDCFAPLLADEITAQKLASLPTAILAEINRLFPGVQPANTPLPDAGPGAHARFFEALRQMAGCLLGGSAPGMLFLDDLQWADSGTLDLLTFLARRMRTIGCILLLSWRSEQSAVGERLTQLIDELQRSNEALRISLNRLSPQEIARLALSHGTHLPARWCEQLYQESEGLPFIALEYLNAMDPSQPDWQLPGGVRALLHTRLQAPGETARQLLTAAAVIGRSFDFATLQVVSGRSEWETITGLEELLQLGLIRERGSSLYDFSHDKLRAVAYEESSTARRRLLHLRAGEAMASGTHAGHENTAWAGLAANHYLQAGQTARAAELYRQAGDQARRLYANSEALSAYQSALAAGHPDVAGLREACGDLFTLMGNYREAVASYQSAAAFCAADCLSSLMHKLGEVYQRRGEWAAAEGHYQAALDAAGADGSPIWLAHLFADWSLTLYRQNQIGPAKELADRSFGQAQAAADPGALAQALNMLGILARSTGDLESARQYFEHSLEWANRLEDASMRCAALNNLARLLQEQGCPREAIPLARQALLLCAHLGDRHRQAAIQNNLADLYHQAGQEKEAMAELKQAVALFAGISEEAWQDYPEIWKMTEW
jgi:predicted ATPase